MDKKMHRVQFETLAALVRTVPVYQLPIVADLARLPDLGQDILHSLAGINDKITRSEPPAS
jgi:hypothetical protein